MKRNKILAGLAITLALTGTKSCKNAEIIHPDFDYQTVYFANQYPVRTVVLGEDLNFDNTLDNQHKVEVKATLGGTRDNKKDVIIDFNVDNTLINNLYFPNSGPKIQALPANYYTLGANQITIAQGNIMGGVQVQLTDTFFADPLAITNTYVLPLKMTGIQHVDSILSHKNFVLYAIKFINQWHGNYLRRGTDMMTGDVTRNVIRHTTHVETDQINNLKTRALKQVDFPIQFRDANAGNIFSCTLLLTFDEAGKCLISTATPGYTVSGTGTFVSKGEKKSWGNKDRDALYLDYQVSYTGVTVGSGTSARSISGNIVTKDTLVSRDRGVVAEYFTPEVR